MEIENNFAVSITGGNHRGDRKTDDFYATTPECVYSFLACERDYIVANVYEPCCGDGAISKLLIEDGFEVYSSDLVDRGYGDTGIDFLQVEKRPEGCLSLITNPPFNLSEQMIVHALEVLKLPYVAMLLKSQYWHSKKRAALFEKHPPAVVYPMLWRPDFLGKGASTMDCQWTVWRESPYPVTRYQPMHRVKKPFQVVPSNAYIRF